MKIATRVALLSALALVCAAPAVAASPPRAVTAPTGLALASHAQTSLGLKWNAVRSASGYNVLLNGSTVATTSGTSWTYLRLDCGTRYSLGVTAKGSRSTSPASILTATTDACPTGDQTPPTSPSGLAVTAVGTSSATVSWHASTDDRGVTGYKVAADGGTPAATTGLSYALNGLLCGKSHSVSVAAYDAAGNLSAPAAVDLHHGGLPGHDAPDRADGAARQRRHGSGATVTWSPATDNVGVAGYRVALDGAGAAQVIGLSYAYTGLACGTSHTVTVAAVDAAGNLGATAATSFAAGACQSTQGTGSGPAAPMAPSTYTVPAGATLVTTAAQLSSALGAGVRDIVLADGTYASSTPFTDGAGSHLYAQHLGGAVLTAGLVVGGNSGPGGAIVQGLSFNVSNTAATLQGGEVTTWGAAGAQLQVLDCTFQGNRTIPWACTPSIRPASSPSAWPSRTSPTRRSARATTPPSRTEARLRHRHDRRHLGGRRDALDARLLERYGGGGDLDRPAREERRAPDQDPERLLVGHRDRQQRVGHHVHRPRHRHERPELVRRRRGVHGALQPSRRVPELPHRRGAPSA